MSRDHLHVCFHLNSLLLCQPNDIFSGSICTATHSQADHYKSDRPPSEGSICDSILRLTRPFGQSVWQRDLSDTFWRALIYPPLSEPIRNVSVCLCAGTVRCCNCCCVDVQLIPVPQTRLISSTLVRLRCYKSKAIRLRVKDRLSSG